MSEPSSEVTNPQIPPEAQPKPSITEASKEWLLARGGDAIRFNDRLARSMTKVATSKDTEGMLYVMGGAIAVLGPVSGRPEGALLGAAYGGLALGARALRNRLYPGK